MTICELRSPHPLGVPAPLWYKAQRGMSEDLPGHDLRAAFVAEQPEAIEQVRTWVRRLVRGAWQFRDPDAVVQDVVLELIGMAREGRIKEGTRFRSFVLTVARHTCIDHHRRARLREAGSSLDDLLDEPVAPGTSAEDAAVAKQRRRMARYVLQSLSEDCRALLRLTFGEDLPAREVGERLGLTEGNVRVRLHRCLQRARTLRERFWGE